MKPTIKRIQPYFVGLTDKTRLMIYLLGTGKYNFDHVRRMTVDELNEWAPKLQPELELTDILVDLCFGKNGMDVVFTNTSDRSYSVKDVIDMLKRAHKIADIPYAGLKPFVESVSGKKKKEVL